MRRALLISVAVTLGVTSILLFCACNKHEGVYKPKQKISKIYYQEIQNGKDIIAKSPKEIWTWEKKKLTKIEIVGKETLKFSYDGSQVSKIESESLVMNFSYEKKKLDNIKISKSGTLYQTITVSGRDNDDRITKLTYETQSTAKNLKDIETNSAQINPILNLMFPSAIAASLLSDVNEAKTHKAGATTTTYEYTYEGNNITKVKETEGTTEKIMIYQYDNKINPYYKSLYYTYNIEKEDNPKSEKNPIMGLSENNIQLYYNEATKMFQTKYEYTYNEDDLPTSIKLSQEVHGATVIKTEQINYIEYVE